MVRADVFNGFFGSFYRRGSAAFSDFRGEAFFAAEGGEMRSDYFNNTAQVRNLQAISVRLAGALERNRTPITSSASSRSVR